MMPEDPHQREFSGVGCLSQLFICAATVSALWVAGSRTGFPTWQGFPNTPFTTLLLLAGAASAKRRVPPCYRWSIVAGLGWSALGDALLGFGRDWFVAGLGSFLAAHLCYLWAFTRDSRLAEHKLPFVLWGVCGMALLPLLWPGVGVGLRIPVVLYTVAILAMAAQAASRAASRRDAAAILAAVGAALFVVSDSVLAFQRFRHPLHSGGVIVLGTYFAAQGGIALSVVVRRDQPA
jgi:uncharacterized membrane protein YhhN